MMFITLAVALAQPIVAPDDPEALFKGDGTVLKFDPSCRDYNLETVARDSACAIRVRAGEPAPSLAIAVQTISQLPERSTEAMALLMHSAKTSNHPAVHYMLGNMLASPSILKPDYTAAVASLAIAAERGNPAAADKLATLILQGKGARRDIPRAIELYSKAAANGFPSAAVSLGKFYLSGRYVPVNEELGRAWFDAAAAIGELEAVSLARLAKHSTKIDNFQLLPAANAADVKVVRYGTFDNPDIPPSFGFDLAFQKVHDIEFDDPKIRAALLAGEESNPTPYLFELARRQAPNDPDKAFKTFLIARMRISYDASRCADQSAFGALSAWDTFMLPEVNFLIASGKLTKQLAQEALNDEALFPAASEPWRVCRSGISEMTAAISGKVAPLKLIPVADWPAKRQRSREIIESFAKQ